MELLTLDKARLMVSITPKAEQLKKELLAKAQAVREVTTDEQMSNAVSIAGTLKGLVRQVEAARKEMQEPLKIAERNINDVAKKFSQKVKDTAEILERMASNYKMEQDRKAEAARREIERIARDARQAEEELARKAQEALLAAEAAKDQHARGELLQKVADIEIESGEISSQADLQISQVLQKEETKPVGASVVHDYDIRVDDVHKLYAAYPQCVSLSPKLLYIKDLIRLGRLNIPGVTLIPRTRIISRISAPTGVVTGGKDVVELQQ